MTGDDQSYVTDVASESESRGSGKSRALLVLVVVALVLIGLLAARLAANSSANGADSRQAAQIRRVIMRYNELLAQGYRSLNMNPMREVASQLQAEDEYIHMSSLAEGGIRLDPELKDVEFVRVSVEATRAIAETRETWDYRHYSRATGALVLEQKALVYELAWDLEMRPDGAWLVTDVRAIGSTATAAPKVIGTITPVPPGQ